MTELSIIIPAYNSEKYIFDCIDSILKDDFKKFEIIVINDGSIDNTKNIVENINDKRIKLFNNENHGVSYSRNFGLSKAIGKYIMFIDADDTIVKNSLQTMMNYIKKDNIDIVIGQYTNLSVSLSIFEGEEINKVISALVAPNKNELDSSLLGFVWGKIYSSKILKNITFDEKINFKEDMLFNLNAYYNSKKIMIIPNKCYNYVLNENSASFKYYKNYEKEIDYFYNTLENLEKNKVITYEDLNIWGIYMYMNYLKHNSLHSSERKNHKKNIKSTFTSKIWNEIFNNVDSSKLDLKYKILKIAFLNRWGMVIRIMFMINEKRKKNVQN